MVNTSTLASMAEQSRPGLTRLGGLRKGAPDVWEREVRAAMAAAGGRVPDAADALDVSNRTLFRWLEEDRFADVERADVGVHRKPKPKRRSAKTRRP